MRVAPLLCVVLALWICESEGFGQSVSNDNFANRLVLSGANPVAVTNLSSATSEPGEPNHAGNSIGKSLWFTWTAPSTGVFEFSTYGSFAAYQKTRSLALYTGNSITSLTEVASSNDVPEFAVSPFAPSTNASFNCAVAAGTTYQIAVDSTGVSGDNGSTVLSVNQAPTIVSSASAAGTVGAGFFYQINVSNDPTGFATGTLPSGLVLDPATGYISGVPTQAGNFSVPISASNPGGTANATLSFVISAPGDSSTPIFSCALTEIGTVGTSLTFSVTASNDATNYSATSLPPGLAFVSGRITGAPTAAGVFPVAISASNPAGTSIATVTFVISPAPQAPVIEINLTETASVGVSYFLPIITNEVGSQGNSNSITQFEALNLPPGLAIDSTSGNVRGTPNSSGTYFSEILATNSGGTGTALVTFVVGSAGAVSDGGPFLTSSATASAALGTAFTYILTGTNNPTAYSASGLPSGLSLNPVNGFISGTPTTLGIYPVSVSATNGFCTASGNLTITVSSAVTNQSVAEVPAFGPPVISTPASANGVVGQSFSYVLRSFFLDSNLSYQATGLPPGISLNASTGLISGIPTAAGTYPATVSTSGIGSLHTLATAAGTVTFIIAPTAPAGPPVITSNAMAAGVVGTAFSYTITSSYPPASYSAGSLPPGLSLNATSGVISGSPTAPGNYTVTLSATNGIGIFSTPVLFAISPQTPPLITCPAAISGTVGSSFSSTISASGSPTSYVASNLPPGLLLNSSTGVISGTPTAAGVYVVPVSASNSAGGGNATLTITINTSSTALPTLSGSPTASGTVGASFVFSFGGSSASFSATNLPPGLALDTNTLAIRGTPTTTGVYLASLSATNSAGTVSEVVTITISAPTTPLFTSAAEASGVVGASFGYTVQGIGAASLTNFSASNLPPGLSIDSPTGLISGKPTTEGIYSTGLSASSDGVVGTGTLTISIAPSPAPPVITSPLEAIGVSGNAFSYTIMASNPPTTFSASGLPSGLNLNATTGAITGAPSNAGVYPITIGAANGGGSASAILTVVVNSAPTDVPVITSAVEPIASQPSFAYTITASNFPSTFSVSNLPAGWTFNSSTHVISGPFFLGTKSVQVSASNSAGTGNAVVTFVSGGTSITSPAGAAAIVGAPFSYVVTVANPGFGISISGLPPGLAFNATTSTISGTPTAAGVYWVSITSSVTTTVTLTLVVSASPMSLPVLASPAEAAGVVGQPAAYTLSATNLPSSFTANSLPVGLVFNSATGVISGTPTGVGTFQIPISATNSLGTTNGVLSISIAALAQPPVISSSLSRTVTPGSFGSVYQITAANGPTSFSAGGLPPGLSLDSVSGIISGVATTAGSYSVRIGAANSGGEGTGSITMSVIAAPPTVGGDAYQTESFGQSVSSFLATVAGADSISVTGLPPGVYIDSSDAILFGTPTQTGVYPVAISASNEFGTTTAVVTIAVLAPSNPDFSSSGVPAEVAVTTESAVNNSIDFLTEPLVTASGLPPGLVFDPAKGEIEGAPTTPGIYPVTLTAANSAGVSTAITTYVVTSHAPFINSQAAILAAVNAPVRGSVTFTNATAFSTSGLPPGLFMSPSTGAIYGMPSSVGIYPVSITATNDVGSVTVQTTIDVLPAPVGVPLITSAAGASFVSSQSFISFPTEAPFTYTVAATNSPSAFSAANLPVGLTINPSTGVISGTPQLSGTFPVTVTASNSAGVGSAIVTILVEQTQLAPALALNTSATAGLPVLGNAFQNPSIGSVVNPAVVFQESGLPPGLSFNFATGEISGKPTEPGIYPVAFSATDAAGTVAEETIFVVSSPLSIPPTNISSQAVAPATRGVSFEYDLVAAGATSFQASGLPAGLSLNSATGQISGVPTAVGTFVVPVTASNSAGAVQATLTVVVSSASSGISFSGATMAVATIGSPFSYSLGASANGAAAPFVYSAPHLPAGLSLNRFSGVISGTPTAPGVYHIPITATFDGIVGSCTLTILIQAPAGAPVIASSAGAMGYLETPFSYLVSASGAANYQTGALPAGLSFAAGSTTIGGLPTQVGSTNVALTASNSAGSAQAMLDLVIEAPNYALPAILSQPVGQAAALGQDVSFSVIATGAPVPTYQWMHGNQAIANGNGSVLNLANVQSSDAGAYSVSISNSSGSVVSVPVLLSIQQSFASWQTSYFTAQEIAQGLAGDLVDANHDGFSNLLEYALSRNPRTGQGGSGPSAILNPDDGFMVFQFTRDPGLTDLNYVVEASSDLINWDQLAQSAGGAATMNFGSRSVTETSSGNLIQVQVEDETAIGDTNRRFIRLRVVRH